MKAYRICLYLAGVAAAAFGISKVVKTHSGRTEESENEHWRTFFGDFFEDPEDTPDPLDIPLDLSQLLEHA